MAYVRVTETLVSDTWCRVNHMRNRALEAYDRPTTEVGTPEFNTIQESVTAAAFVDAPELRGKLPESWYWRKENIRFIVVTAGGQEVAFDADGNEHNHFHIPKHVADSYYRTTMRAKYASVSPEMQELVDSELERTTKRAEISEQFNSIRTQVGAFIRQHASLNAALKAMPELELYVPQSYLDRVAAPTPPRNKPKPVDRTAVNIDVDALTAIGVAHRIGS